MPTPPLPDVLRELLARPNPAVMATLRSDGYPVTVPTWYVFENDRVLVSLDESRKRLDHLRRDPRVSLTVFDGENWYTHVGLIGRVDELADDTGLDDVDRIARHYTGEPYPVRDRKRVSAWLGIEAWHAWNVPE
jgi:PPOX class probable F420-dependent enzyme